VTSELPAAVLLGMSIVLLLRLDAPPVGAAAKKVLSTTYQPLTDPAPLAIQYYGIEGLLHVTEYASLWDMSGGWWIAAQNCRIVVSSLVPDLR
jgi:hypothetical protein